MPPFHSRSTGACRIALHQLGRGHRFDASPSMPSAARTCGAERDRLRDAREDAAALGDQRGVVVVPARAGQVEQPLALGVRRRRRRGRGRGRCGGGRMRPPAGCARSSSMPLPNTSPDMSPMPTAVKSSVWQSIPRSRKWRLHRLPRAAGGDAHRLVVVAGRAAGGEGVAEPEAVVARRRRWRCRRRSRCPCRRRPRGRCRRRRGARRRCGGDDLAVDDVVGDVEQAGDERLVAGDALGQPLVAVAAGRAAACTKKPPFAPTGTITVFLTICAFMRPSTSVRKSSRRSDQRRPPRATGPKRRCTPSTRGE